MAEVLTPNFELFGSKPQLVSQLRECVPKAMRIEVGQSRSGESLFENVPDRRGVAPMLTRQSYDFEPPIRTVTRLRRWKQRVVIAPQLLISEEVNPIDYDFPDDIANRKEARRECLAALGIHFPRVLLDFACDQVDVFQFERRRRAITRPRKQNKGAARALIRARAKSVRLWANTCHDGPSPLASPFQKD